jgi:hypothetical protein
VTSQPDESQSMDAVYTGDAARERQDPDLVVLHADDELDQSAPRYAADDPADGSLSEQWHDIQAMFVDDPRGSVQRAAQAADAAVGALVESLRESQAALMPADTAANVGDTEQLRGALRSYRVFCQRIADLDEQLPRAESMTR